MSSLVPILQNRPRLDSSVFVAESAKVIGEASLGSDSSVWFGAVIRADIAPIAIGARTNVQDQVLIHVRAECPVKIGDDVTIGHQAAIHGCTIGNRVLVGIRAVLLDDVSVEDDTMIAAGSVVAPGTVVPSGWLMMGTPAKPKRKLRQDELDEIRLSAERYVQYAKLYLPWPKLKP